MERIEIETEKEHAIEITYACGHSIFAVAVAAAVVVIVVVFVIEQYRAEEFAGARTFEAKDKENMSVVVVV